MDVLHAVVDPLLSLLAEPKVSEVVRQLVARRRINVWYCRVEDSRNVGGELWRSYGVELETRKNR